MNVATWRPAEPGPLEQTRNGLTALNAAIEQARTLLGNADVRIALVDSMRNGRTRRADVVGLGRELVDVLTETRP
jgi:hypothetical protein